MCLLSSLPYDRDLPLPFTTKLLLLKSMKSEVNWLEQKPHGGISKQWCCKLAGPEGEHRVTNFTALNLLLTIGRAYEHYNLDFYLQFGLGPDLYQV